jgi:hypothetical protein
MQLNEKGKSQASEELSGEERRSRLGLQDARLAHTA